MLISTLLTSSLLIGGTFAAYAVTDLAEPVGGTVGAGQISEDDTTYITLNWGESSFLNNIEMLMPGTTRKAGVIALQSDYSYEGVLTITLADATTSRIDPTKKLIDYLKVYLYEGAHSDLEDDVLPEGEPLCSTALKQTEVVYNHAVGTNAGKEYSIYIEYDNSGAAYSSVIANDVIDLTVDWSAQSGDEIQNSKNVYFSSSWDKCYLYTWNGNSVNAIYPGIEMTKIGLNQYGQYVYKGILLGGFDKAIFSNGGGNAVDKTKDIDLSKISFAAGELLMWKDDSQDVGVGTTVFDPATHVTGYDVNIAKNPGPILHAWDWTVQKVRDNLSSIKDAGYKAIQLSPLQPLNYGGSNQGWYMVYQPVGFSVATNNTNPLGNKSDLIALTAEAKECDIDIIVDVVANHLAAGSDYQLNNAVRYYEQEIFDNNLIHNNSEYGEVRDDDIQYVVRANVGKLPDLKTEDGRVQKRVISMLKEYIDCGVNGFRFDAAKHIETPTDGYYSSDFWPNIIGSINQYGLEKNGKAPYVYGEILGVGNNRSWEGYTRYIDVTDSSISYASRSAFSSHNTASVIAACNYGYGVGGATNALVYAETHDNFCHGDTTLWGNAYINMIYCLQASRSTLSTLYYTRPVSNERNLYEEYGVTKANPNIIVYNCEDDYKNAVLSATHKLHNDFEGGSEYLTDWDGYVINVRSYGDKYGIFICDPSWRSEGQQQNATITVRTNDGNIGNGTYLDLINKGSGNTDIYINSNGGSITVNLKDGIAVLIQQ